jgi:putative Mn2+ efflux pump MntP
MERPGETAAAQVPPDGRADAAGPVGRADDRDRRRFEEAVEVADAHGGTAIFMRIAGPRRATRSPLPGWRESARPMSFFSMLALALAMSTDAFAAAVGKGAVLHRPRWSEAIRTGAIFGSIEALTPLVGWAIGSAAARYVTAWDHWIAFALLAGLGVRMIWAGARGDVEAIDHEARPGRHAFWLLALTGFATSIDAMAVGVGLAFIDVAIVPVAITIGLTTFAMVTMGVMLGRVLGIVAGKRAEIAGGVLLIVIGLLILAQHLRAP